MITYLEENQAQMDAAYSENQHIRSPYQKIDNQLREQLIYEIVHQGNQLKQTADKYGLKYSTVKGIVQVYQFYGRCSKKQKRNKKFFQHHNQTLILINMETGSVELKQQQKLAHVEIIQDILTNPQLQNRAASINCFENSSVCFQEQTGRGVTNISRDIFHSMNISKQIRISCNELNNHCNKVKVEQPNPSPWVDQAIKMELTEAPAISNQIFQQSLIPQYGQVAYNRKHKQTHIAEQLKSAQKQIIQLRQKLQLQHDEMNLLININLIRK